MPEELEIRAGAGYGSAFERGNANDDVVNAYFFYGDKIGEGLSFRLGYNRKTTNGFANQLSSTLVENTAKGAGGDGKYYTEPCVAGSSGTCPASTANPAGTVIDRYFYGKKGDQNVRDEAFTVNLQYEFNEETKLKLNFFRNELETTYDVPHTMDGIPVYISTPNYSAANAAAFQARAAEWGRNRNLYSGSFETKSSDLFAKLSLSLLDVDYYTSMGSATNTNINNHLLPPTNYPSKQISFYDGYGLFTEAPSKTYLADLQFSLPQLSNQNLTWGLSHK